MDALKMKLKPNPHFSSCFCGGYTRRFKDLSLWAKNQFEVVVNPTDEAFVLQMGQFNLEQWKKEALAAAECTSAELSAVLGECT